MTKLYSSPLRVYLGLGVLALVGILCGSRLPVSLFPNSSKPKIVASIPYGSLTPDEFLVSYGRYLEEQLQAVSGENVELEKLETHYGSDRARFEAQFKWGVNPKAAQREVETIVNSFSGRLPDDIRNGGVWVWPGNENSGFVAISFFSPQRSMEELYEILDAVVTPQAAKVQDAMNVELWNPQKKEVRIELKAEKMAPLQLLPKDVDHAVMASLGGNSGGSITVGPQQLTIQMPSQVKTPEELGHILVATPSGHVVHLSDIARIDYTLRTTDTKSFKTSGNPSVLLYADPKPGGNIKRMAEGIVQVVKEAMPKLPSDVHYQILVDPSEFINSAVHNVLREVMFGALLAVVVLFIFIGSFRNTVTAAIEIPLSMVLAFILMKISGMNLNIISLGGLALSAGMNVDASVVVMENIFRHFEDHPEARTFGQRLAVISAAVAEVRFAVIASTIASLVVFIPLAFTSELSYAVLGDLAKTVVFSHAFSAFVALILVPTVRLQLMTSSKTEMPPKSILEPQIRWLESAYGRALGRFIQSSKAKSITYVALAAVLAAMLVFVLPRLPRDLIGTPDTDWLMVNVNTTGNTLLKQMESMAEEVEAKFLNKMGDSVRYTFTQIRGPNNASIMGRLKDKSKMKALWKDAETYFTDTPTAKFRVNPWNPSELPIPDPAQLEISLRGGSVKGRVQTAQELQALLEENHVFPRIWSDPGVDHSEAVIIRPRRELWQGLRAQGILFSPADLSDFSKVATAGRKLGVMPVNGRTRDVFLRYPDGMLDSVEALASLPVGAGSKIVPLKALAQIQIEEAPPNIYRVDGRELFEIYGKRDQSDQGLDSSASVKKAHELIDKWKASKLGKTDVDAPVVTFEDAERDIHEALSQLGTAIGLSILLIFLTLLVQFGSVANAALVLVAVPLGFIGVLTSLFVFRSTLSLNSALGVILLNGIAVNNSIILVDFLRRQVEAGLDPAAAAVEAGKRRLRPILITSLTTILGMIPVALGLGEGGRILQPLGIAVSGGLWVSMALTLFVVPALQVAYLQRKTRLRSTPVTLVVPTLDIEFPAPVEIKKRSEQPSIPTTLQ